MLAAALGDQEIPSVTLSSHHALKSISTFPQQGSALKAGGYQVTAQQFTQCSSSKFHEGCKALWRWLKAMDACPELLHCLQRFQMI